MIEIFIYGAALVVMLPITIYLCVKFGTFAFYRGKEIARQHKNKGINNG
jgi:hypothetical protein